MNFLDTSRGRKFLFAFLYASEGAPIGFIWWALPTLLRSENVSIDKITGLTAILVLPWVFKFLWAPLVDSLRSEKWGFKNWIILSQLIMGSLLIPMLFLDFKNNFQLMSLFLILHSFFAATQDVSVDALAINVIDRDERGSINGFMQAGMLTGRSLFGGGILFAANYISNSSLFIFLIIFIWFSLILVLFIKEPNTNLERKTFTAVFPKIKKAFSKKNTLLGLAFALISASAFEAAGALAGPFLIDHNVTKETVGIFFGIPVVLFMLIGSLIGGRVSDKIDRKKAIAIFLIGFVSVIIVLSLVEEVFSNNVNYLIWLSLLTLMYLFIGLFTSSSYAMFMDLTDPEIGATQFSTFMAATNGCESWSVWFAGLIIAGYGYSWGFLFMCAISLLSLIVLKVIRLEE